MLFSVNFHCHLVRKWHRVDLLEIFCRPLGHWSSESVCEICTWLFKAQKASLADGWNFSRTLSREFHLLNGRQRLWLIVSGTWSFSSLLSYSVKLVDCDLCKQTMYNCSRFFGYDRLPHFNDYWESDDHFHLIWAGIISYKNTMKGYKKMITL
jgi:hypothetical protein